jgi:hypothetical protein
VTKREHSLALFHLLGKILYNKRRCYSIICDSQRSIFLGVGDPLSESLSKADRERERNLDKLVLHPPPLPSHLSQFRRPGSRIDVEVSCKYRVKHRLLFPGYHRRCIRSRQLTRPSSLYTCTKTTLSFAKKSNNVMVLWKA